MNRRALQAKKLILTTLVDKVKIQFSLEKLTLTRHEGRLAFIGTIPDRLLRLQRREYYRLIATNPHNLSCLIPVTRDGEQRMISVEATVLDISGGGLALLVPPGDPSFEPDRVFADCRLMLPESGPITTSLRVRNLFRITNRDGSVMLRAGCEFIDLSSSMASTIQRYILKAERERNARERIR